MKRLSVVLALGASLVIAATALAGSSPVPKVTGSVGLASPLQYASFNAFDYGTSGDRGTFHYTNFGYLVAGSGVWNVLGTHTMTGYLGAMPFVHTMNVDTIVPTSPTSLKFSGTGFYNADPSYTWTLNGTVTGSGIAFHILYTGTNAGYFFDAVGTIAADGSMSGTATDSALQSPLTWTMGPGSAYEVFSYTAAVTCVDVSDSEATFGFVIPAGNPLSGLPVVVHVHDGGTPGTDGDTWQHDLGTCISGATTGYPIVSGNLVVH